VILGDLTTKTAAEGKRLYEQGVAAAERELGSTAFIDDAGHFWGLLETRPYMRARFGLARAEYHLGNHSAAIAHAEELLRLNPQDNQGSRYVLLNWLLTKPDRRDDVAKLLRRYDDASAEWEYGRALHLFKIAGASRRAVASLRMQLRPTVTSRHICWDRRRYRRKCRRHTDSEMTRKRHCMQSSRRRCEIVCLARSTG
jgi:tetratricopeptide (TPR) repeat protein